jgi:bacillolysin
MYNSFKKSICSFALVFTLCFFVNIFGAVPQTEIAKKSGSASITAAEIESIASQLQSNFRTSSPTSSPNVNIKSATMSNVTGNSQSSSQNDSNWNLVLNKSNGTPRYILFNGNQNSLQKKAVSGNLIQNSIALIESNQDLFKIKNPANELKLQNQSADTTDNIHLRFSQYVKNIAVWGKEITFHYRADGSLYCINAAYIPTPEIEFDEKIDSNTAVTIALNSITKSSKSIQIPDNLRSLLHYQGPVAMKCIWNDPITFKLHLSWQVNFRPNIQEKWVAFIDATSGEVLWKFNQIPNQGPVSASARDANGKQQVIQVYNNDEMYYMIDASRKIWIPNQTDILNGPKGALWTVGYNLLQLSSDLYQNIISYDNTWKDSIAVSAHKNAELTYEYFTGTFNRRSFDDSGSTIMSIVHWPDWDGQPYDNAFWNGNFVAFGDGKTFRPLAAGLDVVAHEITHGVIQYTVNLEYQFQSGALNESFADIFASMVDRDDYLIGEDISSSPLRNMEHPESCGQPSHMRNFVQCSINDDNGGVHYNSGIPNNACFRIANEIGKEKTEQIFYRILSAGYINSQSEFIDLRLAALQATKDLYNNDFELSAVARAFDSVGILADSILIVETPLEKGSSWVVAVSSKTNTKKLTVIPAYPELASSKYLTSTPIYASSSKPYSIARNGELLLFIDQNNNIHSINLTTTTESVISNGGIWSSIALSPDGSIAAATTTFKDSSIYIFNVNNPSKSSVFNLNSLQKHLNNLSILYADALEWNKDGSHLAFDCYCNKIGDNASFWNIALLDTKNKSINFPTNTLQNPAVDYANPTFSHISDQLMLYEKKDFNNNKFEIQTLNLISGTISHIVDVTNKYTYPTFSHNDSCIIFQQNTTDQPSELWKFSIPTESTLSATPVLFASDYILPSWLSIEDFLYADRKDTHSTPLLISSNLKIINNTFCIEYSLAKSMNVAWEIFDCRGRRVHSSPATLQNSGNHHVFFVNNQKDSKIGSGLYICKINFSSNNYRESRYLKTNLIR